MPKQSSTRERSRTLAPRDFPKSVDAFPLDSRDDAFEWLRRARDWWPDLSAKQHKAAVELAGSVYLDDAKAGRAIGALLAHALESGAVEVFRAARAAWLELGWRERQHVQAIVSGQETLDGWIFMEHDAEYAIVEYYPTRKARHRASKRLSAKRDRKAARRARDPRNVEREHAHA